MHFFLYPDKPYSRKFWLAMDVSGPRARQSLVKPSPERRGLSRATDTPSCRVKCHLNWCPHSRIASLVSFLSMTAHNSQELLCYKKNSNSKTVMLPQTFTVVGTFLKIMSSLKADQEICGREGQREVSMPFPSPEFLYTCLGRFQNYPMVAVRPKVVLLCITAIQITLLFL